MNAIYIKSEQVFNLKYMYLFVTSHIYPCHTEQQGVVRIDHHIALKKRKRLLDVE